MSVTLSFQPIRLFFTVVLLSVFSSVSGQHLYTTQKDSLVTPDSTFYYWPIGVLDLQDCTFDKSDELESVKDLGLNTVIKDMGFDYSGNITFMTYEYPLTINGLNGYCLTTFDTNDWVQSTPAQCYGTNQSSNFVYAADSSIYLGAFFLKHYNPQNNILTDLGYVGINGQLLDYIEAITFYQDELYVSGYRSADFPNVGKLVKVNLNDLWNSTLIASFGPFEYVKDLETVNVGCDSSLLYCIKNDSIFQFDFNNEIFLPICKDYSHLSNIASPSAHQHFDCIPSFDLDQGVTGLDHISSPACILSGVPFYFLENIAPTILTNTIVDSVWVKLSDGNINGADETIFCGGNVCSEKDGGLLFHNSDFMPNEEFMKLLKNNLSYINNSISPTEGMREIVFVPYHKDYVGDTATLYLPVNLAAYAGDDGTLSICQENTSVNLLDYLNGSPEADGNWVPETNMGDGDFNPILDEGVEYIYILEGGECPDDSASVYVEINTLPVFSFIADELLCSEENTVIEIDMEGEEYLWSNGSSETELTVFDSGEYWLELTDGNGCSWRDSVFIYFGENIEESVLMEICEGDYIDFLESEIYSDTAFCETYNSVDGCDSTFCFSVNVFPIYEKTDTAYLENGIHIFNGMEYDFPGVYSFNLISENGCDSIFNLILLEDKIMGDNIYIPNAFSPNGDRVNDLFEIYPVGDFQLMEVKIFDRWGSMVFYSENEKKWDGNLEGEWLPVGIYAYVLKIKNPAGTMEYKNGAVNLFR